MQIKEKKQVKPSVLIRNLAHPNGAEGWVQSVQEATSLCWESVNQEMHCWVCVMV